MRGVRNSSNDVARLDLTVPPPPPPPPPPQTPITGLSIYEAEPAESKIRRLISEHPVIIFTRSSSCCMCHVMKKLLSSVGVQPTVIELDDAAEMAEIASLASATAAAGGSNAPLSPSLFIGGACVGGLESLVALHLSGHLVPRLVEVGALWA